MKTLPAIIYTDTRDFLATLLWLNEGTERDAIRHGNVYQFSLAFIKAVDGFISGFRDYLTAQGFDLDRLDYLERSFGGNCLLSLSGHGCGFFDEYGDPEKTLGDDLQRLIEAYAGKYRFEELEHSIMRRGKISLALRREHIAAGLKKLFTV